MVWWWREWIKKEFNISTNSYTYAKRKKEYKNAFYSLPRSQISWMSRPHHHNRRNDYMYLCIAQRVSEREMSLTVWIKLNKIYKNVDRVLSLWEGKKIIFVSSNDKSNDCIWNCTYGTQLQLPFYHSRLTVEAKIHYQRVKSFR